MPFIYPCKASFFRFFFIYYNHVCPKYRQRYKKDDNQRTQTQYIRKLYRRIGFPKENSYYLMKHQKKKNFSFACN